MSTGSLAVTSEQVCRTAAGAPLPAATFFPFEDGPYRWSDSVNYITYLLENSHSGVDLPAALILETVQAEGGVYVASPEWLRQIRSLCDRFGVVMIVDDVQVGCGRTGDFFSFEAAGIKPDIVCLSKSLSGYGLPMAITLIKRELDLWNPGEHTGTFRGSQLSLLAATVALDLWRCATFVGELKTRSQYLDARVRGIAAGLGHLASRGRGLIWAIDFTDAGGADSARRAALAAFRLGLLVERCGPDGVALKLLPPILIDDDAIDKGCDLLSEACRLAQ
jgi:diaminobutyrate-2-oxoglutarate transaminase